MAAAPGNPGPDHGFRAGRVRASGGGFLPRDAAEVGTLPRDAALVIPGRVVPAAGSPARAPVSRLSSTTAPASVSNCFAATSCIAAMVRCAIASSSAS